MIVVDSSAWIEWLIGSPVADRLASAWPSPDVCLVPTLVQLELQKWAIREIGEDQADQIQAHLSTCVIMPLDTRVALLAAECCARHRLATADAVIYATAQTVGAELLTCDAHFEGLDRVRLVRKAG